jgi:hypothetical protein
MKDLEQAYIELSFYTLAHPDISFIHQHVADAQTAQTADKNTKPISIIFSLVGLFLYVEKNYTGKQIQQFHMNMSKNKRTWPSVVLPAKRGAINASDVLAISPGPERDNMIHKWCVSVWDAYKDSHETIKDLAEQFSP